jgi:hypothetical protein
VSFRTSRSSTTRAIVPSTLTFACIDRTGSSSVSPTLIRAACARSWDRFHVFASPATCAPPDVAGAASALGP